MRKVVISWCGDINDATYIVDEDKVDAFMSRFNNHGNWVVVRGAVYLSGL